MKKKPKIKRIFKLLIIALIIIISIIFFGKLLKKEHNITYHVNNYQIKESFSIKDKKHYYDFTITKGKKNYIVTLNNNFHKQKKIIKEIKSYKEKDLSCIIPIYKKETSLNIYCELKNQQATPDYLIKSNNKEFQKILKKAAKYNLEIPKSSLKIKKYKKVSVYKDNLSSENKYIIWDYKGIYILGKDNYQYQKIFNYDLYDNIMSTIVDKYFVIFENTSVNGIENIYYYDLEKDKLKKYQLEEKISKDSYINGVEDNLIYVTDRKKKKQFTINIKKEKILEVGNDEIGYQKYSNNKLQVLSISDFFMKDQFFSNESIKDKDLSKEDLRKENNSYYYLEDNKMYKVMDYNKENPILLFELKDIKEWKIAEENIVLISKNKLYVYNEKTGLQPIVSSNELNYNYKNICLIWKK